MTERIKHSNIAVFVPHIGCPNVCSFCNQHTISGECSLPSPDDVSRMCEDAAERIGSPDDTEIAFFGGSFTAIDRSLMTSFLSAAADFVKGVGEKGVFKGIRISTRPDCIDGEVLDILTSYGVTAVELGAQSMCDRVLAANGRGHTAEDVAKASQLIKSCGLELGLQMMTGLYRSGRDDELATMDRIIELAPDTVRIYPTVILEGTRLACLYRTGEYVPMPFDSMVELCALMLERFEEAGIKVIKCGLHASDGVEGEMIGGFYHPSFRELCETVIFRRHMEQVLDSSGETKSAVFYVSPKRISQAVGHKRANIGYFGAKGIKLAVRGDKAVTGYACRLESESCGR